MLRGLPILVFSLVAALASGPVLSQAYPARPIKLVVPFPPGGAVDFMGRLLAQEMSKGLGQPVLVENRPGGGSTIGVGLVANAPPDGYSIGLGGNSALAINVALTKLPYDPVKDLAPVSLIQTLPMVAVAYPGAGIESVGDLIAKAKARQSAIAFGSSGNGTPPHLAGELFKTMTGTNLVHVPYKGTIPALTALIAGEIPVAFVDLPAALPYIRSGKVRGLATTGSRRPAAAADLPTMAEAGLAGYEVIGWTGVIAPAGTPPQIVQQLSAEVNRVMNLPEVREKLLAVAVEPMTATPEQFSAFIAAEIPRWARLVQASGAKLD
jgi:tripartite-type tricarboxylate transporter receptor subunit TctC